MKRYRIWMEGWERPVLIRAESAEHVRGSAWHFKIGAEIVAACDAVRMWHDIDREQDEGRTSDDT